MSPAEENARSKELLLAAVDHHICLMMQDGTSKGLVDSLVMNRNRVAKLFDLPVKRKQSYGGHPQKSQD